MSYTNDLHEAPLTKVGPTFWKCWRSKFETRASPTRVGGCVDLTAITNNVASYFSEEYAPNNRHRASSLYNEYISLRENYFGLCLAAELAFHTELVSKISLELKPGKAADTNGLTADC